MRGGSRRHPEFRSDGLNKGFALGDVSRDDGERLVVEDVRSPAHEETHARRFAAPFRGGDGPLLPVIPEAETSAFEDWAHGQKQRDRILGRVDAVSVRVVTAVS